MTEVKTSQKRKFRLLPATEADVIACLENLRQSDIDEVTLMAKTSKRWFPGWNYKADLLQGISSQDVWAMWADDDIMAIGGVADMSKAKFGDKQGLIWMLGTPFMDKYWRPCLRMTRSWIAMKHKEFIVMGNAIPAKFSGRIKWLQKLGFDFSADQVEISDITLVTFWSHRE